MKIAHLILTHKNPEQLERLINALDHPAFDFYIHIDQKVNDAPFQYLFNRKNVYQVKERAKVYWAAYGTIQATLNGFKDILQREYDYINVISAQDFPLKPAAYIYNYFLENKGTEFITCESMDSEGWNVGPRVREYHLINWQIPGKFRLGKIITRLLPPRKFPLDYKIVGRANWFTITSNAAKYILSFIKQHPEVVRYFKYCWGADEFFFSTILYNNPDFQSKIENNLVYVDWPEHEQTGHPRVLNSTDFDKLKISEKLFARKFDMNADSNIIAMLEKQISAF